ncbi:DNA alkylation repair enzyme [Marinomonas spartinae]|uniref:DNA alkylation repair enzyme n=1 Tax=Marinomonas spartinae TaxID=1792290 RepID=A0A1A8TS08_9GAMM|nr:DNA alkylation repair protein [Marinomonas spartinae]SBS29551.1 DNA alkylation repair enzyme [Marinomonas spartinae]SBS36966.1 DNA alkylation repair enzyme [Marinomonas spartinae]
MSEPFKNLFNDTVIRKMAGHFQHHWTEFDAQGFTEAACYQLETLELKERSAQITKAMASYLPKDFIQAGNILLASLATESDSNDSHTEESGITGWAIMPMADYVGQYGIDYHEFSMTLLNAMTRRFTSEFGIRFFLLTVPEKTLNTLDSWITDQNKHVRRLISEGTRPRLPWAMQLPDFIKDPTLVIRLLEKLLDDPEEYVRRSVANNLNDIAKDHPDLVADLAIDWMKGANTPRQQLLRHACRTLLKQGHTTALKAFGYGTPELKSHQLTIATPSISLNQSLVFSFSLSSDLNKDQTLMIDYVIHHQKKNGTTSPKVFKWKKVTLPASQHLFITKKHLFKPITTRAYYSGQHSVEIMINGVSMAKEDFLLTLF